eukprot:12162827-Prorocentrum_lima.AAC.1
MMDFDGTGTDGDRGMVDQCRSAMARTRCLMLVEGKMTMMIGGARMILENAHGGSGKGTWLR